MPNWHDPSWYKIGGLRQLPTYQTEYHWKSIDSLKNDSTG